MAWARPLSVAAALLTGVVLVAGVLLAVVTPTPATVLLAATGLLIAAPASLGTLITRKQPASRVGLWLVLVGWTLSMVTTKEIGIRVLDAHRDQLRAWIGLIAAVGENAWLVFAATGLLLLYFPDSRLPGPRWRWVPPAVIVCALLQVVGGAFDPAPFRSPLSDVPRPFPAWPAWLGLLSAGAFVLLLVLVFACAISVVIRYRRGDHVRRQQIKWLALAGFGVPLYPPLCLLEIIAFGRPLWFSAAVGVAGLIALPVATGIAVLRHDLYDVDKAWVGTVTWALVTITLLGIYAASSSLAGFLLGRDSAAAAAVVTAVCALALSPLRSRLQHRVDQRLYPLRAGALAAIDSLHREASSVRGRPEDLEPVLRAALRDPALRIGYQVPGQAGFLDVQDRPVTADAGSALVRLRGQVIGVLVPGAGVASAELLRRVGEHAATLVEVVRLRMELARALRDVESSRARLVQSGYQERRQLERDLHDGAQQRLVSLGMAIRLAQRHLDDGTVDVAGLLDQSVAELGTAVAELRQIARGLRPGSLDDGLPAALAGLVRTVPVAVEMQICPDPLPDDVATTVYYVVSEAVANAVKHAEASCIWLRVARSHDHVMVSISDDGQGGASLHPKSALADRVAALGGRLKVVSPTGQGTVVEAALPCAS